jgi:hypothetical protein
MYVPSAYLLSSVEVVVRGGMAWLVRDMCEAKLCNMQFVYCAGMSSAMYTQSSKPGLAGTINAPVSGQGLAHDEDDGSTWQAGRNLTRVSCDPC